MKRIKLLAMVTATALSAIAHDYTQFVNPLMGTQSSYELSAGNTYPAIARPWGMNFWTPQTGGMGDGWTYTYDAHKIRGLKQTHQPSPWINDYGQFSIMPTVGAPVFNEEDRASWFSHKGEIALPHYYKVYLADYDIVAEVSPSERAAMFRFTFPQTNQANIVIDAFDKGSSVSYDRSNNRIIGYTTRNSGGVPDNFRNYFVIEFDRPVNDFIIVKDSVLKHDSAIECDHAGGIAIFNTGKGEQIIARVASSFISAEQALLNLKELDRKNFDTLVEEGRDSWSDELGRIKVEDGKENHIRTFYSCLYRCLLFPRKFYEVDANGEIVHYSPHTGKIHKGYLYTDTGLWDTFRALFPLLNLFYPDINKEIQEGMLNHYRESGFFPEWASPGHRGCMVGNNSASVLADAYLNGVKVDDVETLWNGIVNGTQAVHPTVSSSGRLGHAYYNTLGYVPYDVNINENVARTLEYAYDDWCIYSLAKALGRPETEQETYAKRALNYQNVFDKKHNLMRGRNADGSFQTPFSPLKWGDAFTEGNSWHYTWSVFHDVQGLIDLMGGRKSFTTMLDSVFTEAPLYDDSYYGFPIHEIREMTVMNMGNYAHGNQPIQHMIYLYNHAGEPWKAQKHLRDVMERMYSPTPDGYCGDEDNGQTSAWYVFSALGFYPVTPCSGEYVIGTPLFGKATLTTPDGKKTIIKSTPEDPYIDTIKINGHNHSKTFFTRNHLQGGNIIEITKSSRPKTEQKLSPSDLPYSFSNHR